MWVCGHRETDLDTRSGCVETEIDPDTRSGCVDTERLTWTQEVGVWTDRDQPRHKKWVCGHLETDLDTRSGCVDT